MFLGSQPSRTFSKRLLNFSNYVSISESSDLDHITDGWEDQVITCSKLTINALLQCGKFVKSKHETHQNVVEMLFWCLYCQKWTHSVY